MALDFHVATDPRDAKPVLSLADSALPLLQGVFDQFERKTGVCIDWYGTNRLTRGHCALLASMVRDAHRDLAGASPLVELVNLLVEASAGFDLRLEGD